MDNKLCLILSLIYITFINLFVTPQGVLYIPTFAFSAHAQ